MWRHSAEMFCLTALEREGLYHLVGCSSHLCDDEGHIGGGGEQALLVLQGGECLVRLIDSVREGGRFVGRLSANQRREALDVYSHLVYRGVQPVSACRYDVKLSEFLNRLLESVRLIADGGCRSAVGVAVTVTIGACRRHY